MFATNSIGALPMSAHCRQLTGGSAVPTESTVPQDLDLEIYVLRKSGATQLSLQLSTEGTSDPDERGHPTLLT